MPGDEVRVIADLSLQNIVYVVAELLLGKAADCREQPGALLRGRAGLLVALGADEAPGDDPGDAADG